jgi:hypothetical protein
LEGLATEDDGIFYGHLVHFTVFCYISWTFGIVRGNLVYISRFGILFQEKSGNPALDKNFFSRSTKGRQKKSGELAALANQD